MLSPSGRFSVYFPRFLGLRNRLSTVISAVSRLAKGAGVDVEVTQRKDVLSVWVYYTNNGQEDIPLYSDWGKDWNEKEVFQVISNMIHGLSFLPEHAVFPIRKDGESE